MSNPTTEPTRGERILLDQNEHLHTQLQNRAEREVETARREAGYLHGLLAKGVTIGEPVDAEVAGCSSCVWHAENATENKADGGSLGTIRSWLSDGYLGKPENVVLHPVMSLLPSA